jgi:hypothetical protein
MVGAPDAESGRAPDRSGTRSRIGACRLQTLKGVCLTKVAVEPRVNKLGDWLAGKRALIAAWNLA